MGHPGDLFPPPPFLMLWLRAALCPDQCSPRHSSTFWRVREIARADRQRSRCAPTRCSHWQTGGIRRAWTCCPPLAIQAGGQPPPPPPPPTEPPPRGRKKRPPPP